MGLGRTELDLTVTNTASLIAWAINTGRAKGADYALWVSRLSGNGKQYWQNQLLWGTTVAPTVTIH